MYLEKQKRPIIWNRRSNTFRIDLDCIGIGQDAAHTQYAHHSSHNELKGT